MIYLVQTLMADALDVKQVLFVVRPHPNNFDGVLFFQHVIYQAVRDSYFLCTQALH